MGNAIYCIAPLLPFPGEAKQWIQRLPWIQQRPVLPLCYLMRAASSEIQAEFLDDYTPDDMISTVLEDRDSQQKVKEYLEKFRLETDLTDLSLRSYIQQFHIHSAQDQRRQFDRYANSVPQLSISTENPNNIFNYILGFELIKMMFGMSWLQHEKLYRLQRNQEEFMRTYIKPIQHAHKLNKIIVPKDERLFFAKRNYFVQTPIISSKKLIALAIATFTSEVTIHLGFSLIRHTDAFGFDYEYIFELNQDAIFC